jgi:hypothetical protein
MGKMAKLLDIAHPGAEMQVHAGVHDILGLEVHAFLQDMAV